MKIKKIVLCNLPDEGELYYFSTPPYFFKDAMTYPPLGLLYLAAQLNDKDVKVIDAASEELTIQDAVSRIISEKPDILGFTAYTVRLYALKTICEKVKDIFKGDIRIVVGGNHTSIYPFETMQYKGIDYLLRGECDYTFTQLIRAIERGEDENDLSRINGLVYHDKTSQIKAVNFSESDFSLDDIPFPRRDLVDHSLYSTLAQDTSRLTTMVSSRGCPFKCNFCDVQHKRIRFRSPDNIIAEIEAIVKSGINEIAFFDDCFNLDRNRIIALCSLIIKKKLNIKWCCRLRVYPFDEEMAVLMKAAGCNRLHFGVESVNNDILKYTKKGITFEQTKKALGISKKLGITNLIFLIFGFPQETEQDLIKAQEIILKELRPDFIYPNVLFPLPGSEFYYELLKNGSLKEDFWDNFVRNPSPDFKVPLFRAASKERLYINFVNNLNRRFYFSPSFIIKNLGKIIDKKNILRSVTMALRILASSIFCHKSR